MKGSNYNSTTGVYSVRQAASADATQAWQKYQSQTSTPQHRDRDHRGHASRSCRQWSGAAGAWEGVTLTEPTAAVAYFCFAASSYAAKQTRKGDLAAAQAVKLAPQLQRLTIKQELTAAKTSPTDRAGARDAQRC